MREGQRASESDGEGRAKEREQDREEERGEAMRSDRKREGC